MKTKEEKRIEALERQEKYEKLSPQQKIEKLDAKLGEGKGAVKEREKLKRLQQQKSSKKKTK